MKRLFFLLASFPFLLGACSVVPMFAPTPTPTATATATITRTATPLPTATATLTPTAAPTHTRTVTPRPSASPTPVRTRTATATKPPAGPSATPSIAQICANFATKAAPDIYVMYVYPATDLVWDTEPRYFRVGLCNTNSAASTPQGKYKIAMTFPPDTGGATQSSPSPAELKAGFNEIQVGPWVPGLRNHLADCRSREKAYTQVTYNDTPDPFYRTLKWMDGGDHTILTIKCGGNFP